MHVLDYENRIRMPWLGSTVRRDGQNTAMLMELEQQGYTILCGHHSYL